jgi:hypothetical protein
MAVGIEAHTLSQEAATKRHSLIDEAEVIRDAVVRKTIGSDDSFTKSKNKDVLFSFLRVSVLT